MIETSILNALTTGSPLPTAAGARVYAMLLPTDTALPAVVYQRIATQPLNSLDGDSALDRVQVQVDCYAATFAAASSLANQVRTALAVLTGIIEGEQHFFEEFNRTYRVMLTFSFWQRN